MKNIRPLHILMVDDDEDDILLAKRALQKSSLPHKTSVVSDGMELLDYLNRKGTFTEENAPMPDLILLDLNMPKMSGKEALKAIRGNKKLAHLPVILFTTSQAEQDILSSYRLGANSYIKKPANFDGLVEIMHILKTYWMQHATLPPRSYFGRSS